MENLFDYLEWRGDLGFEIDPVNEVDSMIFSQLSYLDFSQVDGGMCLQKSCEAYFKSDLRKSIKVSAFIEKIESLFKKMALTTRFKDVVISDYADRYNIKNQSQFSATTFLLGEDDIFLAFRGTDDSLIGFKEDFNMSFSREVPGQKEAVKYLNTTMEKYPQKVYVGGHSKGGNFAVYSVLGLDKEKRSRIVRVYNFDGPGFCSELTKTKEYIETSKLVKKFMPKDSIVGILMYHNEDAIVVDAKGSTGFIQHDGFNWRIRGKKFIVSDEFSNNSIFLDRAAKKWITSYTDEEKARFVDEMYEIIKSATKVERIGQINENALFLVVKLLRSISELDQEKKSMMQSIILSFIEDSSEHRKSEFLKFKGEIRRSISSRIPRNKKSKNRETHLKTFEHNDKNIKRKCNVL